MVRTYASILGLLAMVVVLLRAMIHGSSLEVAIPRALGGMLVFSVVGAIVGAIAKKTVEDSVQLQFKNELGAMSDLTAP